LTTIGGYGINIDRDPQAFLANFPPGSVETGALWGEEAFRESIARCIVCRKVRQKDNTSPPASAISQARDLSREYEMLQTVHDEFAVPRASSLYCVWIPSRLKSGPPLVALRIDDQNRAFETDCNPEVSREPRELWDEQVQ
jgi:hypothetical protein